METVDEEFLGAALDFIDRQAHADDAMVLLLQPEPNARLDAFETGIERHRRGLYPDGMVELDGLVGQLLESSTTSASRTTPSLFHQRQRRGDCVMA